MMTITTIVGFLGSITAAGLFFPQVWKSYQSKQTDDLAWSGIAIGALNGIFWTTYGVLRDDPFIYITNTILLLGAILLAMLKKKYDTKKTSR